MGLSWNLTIQQVVRALHWSMETKDAAGLTEFGHTEITWDETAQLFTVICPTTQSIDSLTSNELIDRFRATGAVFTLSFPSEETVTTWRY